MIDLRLMMIFLSIFLFACSDGADTSSDASASLSIEQSSLDNNDDNVYLNQALEFEFSQMLAEAQAEDAVEVYADGEKIDGRAFTLGKKLHFIPSRFKANTEHFVYLKQVASEDGQTVSAENPLTFITSDQLSDGSAPPADNYNPLTGSPKATAFQSIPELVFTQGFSDVFDTGNVSYVSAYTDQTNSEGDKISNQVTGSLPVARTGVRTGALQLDEDIWDEIVTLVPGENGANAQFIISDSQGNAGSDSSGAVTMTHTTHDASMPYHSRMLKVAGGDFDWDGKDEILLIGHVNASDYDGTAPGIHYAFIDFDTETQHYSFAHQGVVPAPDGFEITDISVSVGDIDVADINPEAVLLMDIRPLSDLSTPGDTYRLYGRMAVLNEKDGEMLSDISPLLEGGHAAKACAASFFNIAVADIDGDQVGEVVVGSTIYTPLTADLQAYTQTDRCPFYNAVSFFQNISSPETSLFTKSSKLRTVTSNIDFNAIDNSGETFHITLQNTPAGGFPNALEAADIDGDGKDEIMMFNAILSYGEQSDAYDASFPEPEHIFFDDQLNYVALEARDMDGDGREDFVWFSKQDQSSWNVEHIDLLDCTDVDKGHTSCNQGKPVDENKPFNKRNIVFRTPTDRNYGNLTLANIDNDSFGIKPVGHKVLLSGNNILAVLGAPPCFEDLGQDTGNCATEFATGVSKSFSSGAYRGASIAATMGFEWQPQVNIPIINIKLAKIELEARYERSHERSSSRAFETSITSTYSAGASNNLVVAFAYARDDYIYEVVSHHDKSKVGTHIVVNKPAEARKIVMSIDHYNRSNGDGVDIGDDLINIKSGDIDSYLTYSQMRQRFPLGVFYANEATGAIAPPLGSDNANSIELEKTETWDDELQFGYALGLSVKGCSPDASGINPSICVGIEGESSGGVIFSWSSSESTTFAGTLTGMDLDNYFSNAFEAGLYIHQANLQDPATGLTMKFPVIDYYLNRL